MALILMYLVKTVRPVAQVQRILNSSSSSCCGPLSEGYKHYRDDFWLLFLNILNDENARGDTDF